MKIKVLPIFALIIVILVLLAIAIWSIPFFSNIGEIKHTLENSGIFAPIIYIGMQVLQVIVAPIPGQIMGFLGGYFFGVWLGTLYSMIGTVIGTLIVASLARKLGKPFVIKFAGKKNYKKFNRFLRKRGEIFLFLIYLLPFFPDDAISTIAGLSKIKIKTITTLAVVGRLPGVFGLSLIGAGVAQADVSSAVVLLSILITISLIIYLKKGLLEKWLYKTIKKEKTKLKKKKNKN